MLLYIWAAAAASAVFVAAGWRTTYVAATYPGIRFCRHWDPADRIAQATTLLLGDDIGSTLEVVLRRLQPLVAHRRIILDVAIHPDLSIQVAPAALEEVLEDLVSCTIRHTVVERLLLTVWEEPGRIAIRVTSDGTAANYDAQQSSLHKLTEQLALNGATLEIEVRSTGTIKTIWLPRIAQALASH